MTRKPLTAAQTQVARERAERAYFKRPTPKNLERLNSAIDQERGEE
jgi:hypothetical protein